MDKPNSAVLPASQPPQNLEPISLDDKLSLIDQELHDLHQFCINNGYTPEQVHRCAAPVWQHMRSAQRQRNAITFLKCMSLALVIVALVYYDPTYRLACVYTRLAFIQLLPYWDWVRYHNNYCVLNNPLFKDGHGQLSTSDCETCEHVLTLERVNNVSQVVMAEDYLKRDIPVVITDAMADWQATKLFDLQFIYELYTNEESLRKSPVCMFASNVKVQSGNARAFLTKAQRGELTNWYSHWENCDKPAARVFRQFYSRPYFLPLAVEVADRNWLFMSTNYNAKTFKPVDLATDLMWISQVKGQNKLRLTPRDPCNSTCTVLFTVLHEGETVVWTDPLWLLDYLPISSTSDVTSPRSTDHMNIAIGGGGFLD